MTDHHRTQVNEAHGPLHTGSGDQYIYISEFVRRDRRGSSPRGVAEDQLLWLQQRFVYPMGSGTARQMLSANGTVLVDGPAGSGRTATARVLLHELRGDAGTLHELLPEEPDSYPDPEVVGSGDRLLLDMADADEAQWTMVQQDLSVFRRTVQARRAHLAVVLPQDRSTRLPGDLDRYRVEIECPDRREVLLRYLLQDGVRPDKEIRSVPGLSDFLQSGRPMHEIADFAGLVRRARSAERDGETFADWCAHAYLALSDRGPAVAKQLTELRAGQQRALLLATAMLHGSHPDAVHRGTASLLRTVDHPRDDSPLLEQADLLERFAKIDAVPAKNGGIVFKELAYDAAVREHFWDHMPDIRGPLRTWTLRCVESPHASLSPEDRDQLVERLADQYLRTGLPEEMASLAQEWTASSMTYRRLRATAQILKHGLLHEKYGKNLRQKIYSWSQKSRLNTGLAQVLVHVCADVMAVRHPDQAVVRLHHLARRERGVPHARDALCRLAEGDHRIRRRVLDRLAREPAPGTWPADQELFLRIADPRSLTDHGRRSRPLLAETAVREWLTTGWASVFEQRPRPAWAPWAQAWLHTASADERHGELLLDILVSATGTRGDLLGALYATARNTQRAAPGGPERGSATTDRLLCKISAAQGLRSPGPPPGHRPTEGSTP